MNRYFTGTIQLVIIITDFIGVILACVAPMINFCVGLNKFSVATYLIYFGVTWFLSGINSKLYDVSTIISPDKFYQKTALSLLIITIMISCNYFLFQRKHDWYTTIKSLLFFISWIVCCRLVYNQFRIRLKKRGKRIHNIIVLGLNDTSRKLVSFLRENHLNLDVVAIMAEKGTNVSITDNPVYPLSLANFQSIIKNQIHEVYSTLTPSEIRNHFNLSQHCRNHGIRLHWVNRFAESLPYPVYLNHDYPQAVYSELKEPLLLPLNRILKRMFDILFSSILIIFCLSWMIPIIGLLIKLESRGSVFFRQKRTGADNRTFQCLKFRTMKLNDHADKKQAVKNDSRVTRLGKFLRHSSLDEFPQLINVFLGHMSIVGPRPHMLKHTEDYSTIFGSYRVRHYVKPGITGWAQINGCRGEISDPAQLKARIVHDLWYIEHWSLGLDLKIMWLTFYKMMRGDKNAY